MYDKSVIYTCILFNVYVKVRSIIVKSFPSYLVQTRMKVCVLGAGGLGCEILKNLAMMAKDGTIPISEIHIIDLDTIELTNLNRQALYTTNDIGKPKANVAARYVMERVHSLQVTPHHTDLTKLDAHFYKQFQFIISGLDGIEPRRFINNLLVHLTQTSNYEIVVPFIDCGSEGFKGHIKTIIPGILACWECSIDTIPHEQATYPMCTIANNPRSVEHIVEYIISTTSEIELQDVSHILQMCKQRAAEFGIDHDTLEETQLLGIIKKIVPSVAATNAIVAAQSCNEMLKIYLDLTDFASGANASNFTTINGADGLFGYSFLHDRVPGCTVCGKPIM